MVKKRPPFPDILGKWIGCIFDNVFCTSFGIFSCGVIYFIVILLVLVNNFFVAALFIFISYFLMVVVVDFIKKHREDKRWQRESTRHRVKLGTNECVRCGKPVDDWEPDETCAGIKVTYE